MPKQYGTNEGACGNQGFKENEEKKGLHTTQSTMIHFSQLPSPVNLPFTSLADYIHFY
jgi:hypothetical protein